MKNLLLIFLALVILCSCATMKYEPPKFEPVVKIPAYKLPPDPFENTEPPIPIFKKADGSPATKEEAQLICYVPKELDKITLRLQYRKEIIDSLIRLINVQIEMTNVMADLERLKELKAEVYKQMWVDQVNTTSINKIWADIEKGGLSAIIIAQLIVILSLAL